MTDRPAALLTNQGSKNKNEDTALAKVSKGELAAVSDAPKKEKISYKDLSISVIEEQYDETMRELYASVGQEYHEETAASSLSKELIVAAFTDKMPDTLMAMDINHKVELYNKYSAIHASWQKAFTVNRKNIKCKGIF